MSLIVTVYVKEGIVMASDSRVSFNRSIISNGKIVEQIGIHASNTTYKTFLCPNNAGISACGDASINNTPIAGYLEQFIREEITNGTQVSEMPEKLINYFQKLSPSLNATFHVAGYEGDDIPHQSIYRINTQGPSTTLISSPEVWGATWDGEAEILRRLLTEFTLTIENEPRVIIPKMDIPFQFFTLQDAIDFSMYAIDTTIKTMKFCVMPESVGFPVDILVIKPDESFWISRKELTVR